MAEYIDLNNTEVLAEAGENAKLVVEEDGELKRIPASAVGQVKTVNGVAPDETGNVDVSGLPTGATAHQQLVTDGEGKAKWEEKAFYETYGYGSESYGTDGFEAVDVGGVYKMEDAFHISLDASKRYFVEQYPDYVCEVKTTQGIKYIGNDALLGSEKDTGEPFIVVENPDSGMAIVILKEAHTSKLFFVHDVAQTVKPIDAKFLPQGVSVVPYAGSRYYFITRDNGKTVELDKTEVKFEGSFNIEFAIEHGMPVNLLDRQSNETMRLVSYRYEIGVGRIFTFYSAVLQGYVTVKELNNGSLVISGYVS